MDDKPGRPDHEIILQVPLFAGLTEAEARALCASSERVNVEAGGLIIEEGAPGDALYILLTGELEVTKHDGDREVLLAVRGPGEVIGEMSILEQTPRTASVRATAPSKLMEIGAATFQQMLQASPGMATTLLRTIAKRLRSTESLLVQSDKLASLGTLAAGLAHELNNPAAAIQRSASLLQEAFGTWRARSSALSSLMSSPAAREKLAVLESEKAERTNATETVLQDLESELIDWLEACKVDESWELGPVLAAYGWIVERLDALAEDFPAPAFQPVIQWLSAGLSVQQLLGEIQLSSKAISGIVGAVKSYSYLDQAPVQDADVQQGLEDTLTILSHKLKHGVEIVRNFEPHLPRIEAYAGELNQVWTNIIDNAVQAMDGKGRLEISTRRIGDEVEVQIADSGPGIPSDIAPHIFEPFFTTKAQGVGTGLGLHIAHNIIVNRHRGRLDFETRPGRTLFRIALPLKLSR